MFFKILPPLFLVLCISSLSYAQPPEFDKPCLGSNQFADVQGVITINGQPANPAEDFVAFFDSDGFVVGTGQIQEETSGFCPQGPTTFVSVAVDGEVTLPGLGCPDDYGLAVGESFTGMIYDASEDLFYEITVADAYANNATLNLTGSGFCDNQDGSALLPSILTAFRGEVAGPKHVRLSWDVAREENSSHYEIQRSNNGFDWIAIDEVPAAGNSETALAYDFNDLDPYGPRQFYRLKIVDTDNSYEYSGIVIIELSNKGDREVNIFPNPIAKDADLSIQLRGDWSGDQEITADLYDAQGRLLMKSSGLAGGTSSLALPEGLRGGMYLLRVHQGQHTADQRILVK